MTDKDVTEGTSSAADVADDQAPTDEQLWAEFEADDTDTAVDDGPDDTPDPDDSDDASEDETVSQERDDTPEQDDVSDDAEQSSEPSDPWASASPEMIAERDRLKESDRRLRGQVSALQRQKDELLAKDRAPKPQQTDDKQAPSDDDLKRIKEDYPEIAGPLLAELSQTKEALSQIQSQFAQQRASEIGREEASFLATHEDGNRVILEHEDEFLGWVEDQPKRIRDIFAANQDDITNGQDAAELVSLFKQHLGVDQPSEEPSNQDRATDRRRKTQMKGARTMPSRGASAASDAIPSDASAEDAWNYWEKKGL